MFISLLVMPRRIPHQKVELCACNTCPTILKRHVSLSLGGLRFIWVLFLDGPVSSISNALCSIFRVLPTWPSLHPPSSPGYLKSHHRRALLLPPHLLILNSETEKKQTNMSINKRTKISETEKKNDLEIQRRRLQRGDELEW